MMLLYRPLFGSYGRNFHFDPDGLYTYSNIFVGDDVSLGWRPTLIAALSEIRIGNKVMFGPNVTIVGGGHNDLPPEKRTLRLRGTQGVFKCHGAFVAY